MPTTNRSAPRVIAYYLPQYHPIPENDKWWGKGFTEWTNVGKAKPLFKGHYQPRIPADLGYYDLRVPETRIAQADMAKEYGIEGFCYWHYWFGDGKRLLERPFTEVVVSGKPDFPFCLGWANHSWKDKSWSPDGVDKMLIEQKYPGIKDYTKHFETLLPAFLDKRYIRVNNRPLFLIWDSNDLPDVTEFIEYWNSLANKAGIDGFHFITIISDLNELPQKMSKGFNSVALDLQTKIFSNNKIVDLLYKILRKIFHIPKRMNYNKYVDGFIKNFKVMENVYPQIISNWDHSPRSGKLASHILTKSTPAKFGRLLKDLFNMLKNKNPEENIVFIRSWNEWAEGNYLEPDLKYGKGHLEVLKKQVDEFSIDKQ